MTDEDIAQLRQKASTRYGFGESPEEWYATATTADLRVVIDALEAAQAENAALRAQLAGAQLDAAKEQALRETQVDKSREVVEALRAEIASLTRDWEQLRRREAEARAVLERIAALDDRAIDHQCQHCYAEQLTQAEEDGGLFAFVHAADCSVTAARVWLAAGATATGEASDELG